MLRDLARELDASPAPKLGFILTGAGVTEQYAVSYGTRGRGDMPRRGGHDRGVGRGAPQAPRALAEQPSSPPSGLIEAEGTGSARAAGEHAPVVTVLTPTYNRASTLGRQYESLLAQSFRDFEWVIVDDGSEDDTQALVKSWADDGKLEIRYRSQANRGKHVAVNRGGVEMARGEFTTIIDSDDFFAPNGLELLVRHWDEIPAAERPGSSGGRALRLRGRASDRRPVPERPARLRRG